MKKVGSRVLATILIVFTCVGSWAHPFHISVIDLVYKPEEKLLQLSARLFLDDLELGLQANTGDEHLDITDEEDFDRLKEEVGNYFLSHFSLSTDTALQFQYLGFEYDQDVLWCYFEAKDIAAFDEISIENDLLLEIYDDQENLVHLRIDGAVQSVRMGKRNRIDSIILED